MLRALQYHDDYDKALAIQDWVTDNIYYDYDSYYSGDYKAITAKETLESKASVCQGYAYLTAALMRACGIPCKEVSGMTINSTTQGKWTEELLNGIDTNHAWNEANIDGRFILIDTTWDSHNDCEDGEYIHNDRMDRIYFDSTLEFFSLRHKIIDN